MSRKPRAQRLCLNVYDRQFANSVPTLEAGCKPEPLMFVAVLSARVSVDFVGQQTSNRIDDVKRKDGARQGFQLVHPWAILRNGICRTSRNHQRAGWRAADVTVVQGARSVRDSLGSQAEKIEDEVKNVRRKGAWRFDAVRHQADSVSGH